MPEVRAPIGSSRPATSRVCLLVLGLIVAVGLLLRAIPLSGPPEALRNGLGPFGDSWAYHVTGYNLASGNGYTMTDYGGAKGQGVNPADPRLYQPAATRAPLYPLFLAGIYKAVGATGQLTPVQMQRTFLQIRLLQAAIDALTCLLVFSLVRLLAPQSEIPALVGAAAYALSPYHAYFSGAILTETLACFLAVSAVLLTTRATISGRWWEFGGSGLLWGLLALCRPEYLLPGAILAGVLAVVQWLRSRSVLPVLAMALGTALAVAPWMLRNHASFGSPFISVGGLGYSLFLGTFEGRFPPDQWNALPHKAFPDQASRQQAESLVSDYLQAMRQGSATVRDIDRRFFEIAIGRIQADPIGTVGDWLLKLPRLGYQGAPQMYRDPEPQGAYALVCLALAGIAVAGFLRRRIVAAIPATAFIGLVALMYLPLHIEPRYGLPMLAIAIGLAGAGSREVCLAFGARMRR